jgi:hypothetical protein
MGRLTKCLMYFRNLILTWLRLQKLIRNAGFFMPIFASGENLSFFLMVDDINDGKLVSMGVENDDNNCININCINDGNIVVISAIEINNGLKTMNSLTLRFSNTFAFSNKSGVFFKSPSLFLGGVAVFNSNAVFGMMLFWVYKTCCDLEYKK